MLYIICICDIICLKGREFMNTVLLSAIIILLIVCLVLLIRLGAKKDGSSNELLKQQIELSSKATDEKILRLSEQMNTLTDKNYKQQIELMKTLNFPFFFFAHICRNALSMSDRKSTRLNSSHIQKSRMPSSA